MAEPDNVKAFDRPPDQAGPPVGSGGNDEGELSEEELDETSGGLLRYGNLNPVFSPTPPPIKPVLTPNPPPIKEAPNPPPI